MHVLRAHGGGTCGNKGFTVDTCNGQGTATQSHQAVVHLVAHCRELGRVDGQRAIDKGQVVVLRRAGGRGDVVARIGAGSPCRHTRQSSHRVAIEQPGGGKAAHSLLNTAVGQGTAVGRDRCVGRRDVQRAVDVADVVVAGREIATSGAGRSDVVSTNIAAGRTAHTRQSHMTHHFTIYQSTGGEGGRTQGGAQTVLGGGAVGGDGQSRSRNVGDCSCLPARAPHQARGLQAVVTQSTAVAARDSGQGQIGHTHLVGTRHLSAVVLCRRQIRQGDGVTGHQPRNTVVAGSHAGTGQSVVGLVHDACGRQTELGRVDGHRCVGSVERRQLVIADQARAIAQRDAGDVVGRVIGHMGAVGRGTAVGQSLTGHPGADRHSRQGIAAAVGLCVAQGHGLGRDVARDPGLLGQLVIACIGTTQRSIHGHGQAAAHILAAEVTAERECDHIAGAARGIAQHTTQTAVAAEAGERAVVVGQVGHHGARQGQCRLVHLGRAIHIGRRGIAQLVATAGGNANGVVAHIQIAGGGITGIDQSHCWLCVRCEEL